MIVSHRHRFIFVKSKKTGGTSVEIALSEHCGPDDIITSLEMDEPIRRELRYPGTQNDLIPWRGYTPKLLVGALKRRRRLRFYNHYRALDIRRAVGKRLWDDYLTFTVERNPYDRSISRYWFDNPEGGVDMLEHLRSLGDDLTNWGRYTIDGQIAVDRVLRYETLPTDLAELGARLGITIELPALRAKGAQRKDRRPYTEVLGPSERALIERVCAPEFAAFGYTWD